jgi:phosphatidylethanolamine-binding protein
MAQYELSTTLVESRIFPDVLPESITLSYDLVVKWPDVTLDAPGKELDREATQPEPKVYLNPPV